jgi:thiamine-monophosphate kinase
MGASVLEPPPADSDHYERRFINTLVDRSPATSARTLLGPGDDGALLEGGVSITVDTLVEGVHFDERLQPEDVGWKAAAVSVSDLAAMGARPNWLVLSLSVPSHGAEAWVEGFSTGLAEALEVYGIDLIGGDTTRSNGAKVISVTMGGSILHKPMLRGGAQAGDILCVTGHLGLAGAGYIMNTPPPAALTALRRPTPPLELALSLSKLEGVHGAMDLSDGLATDLPRLCRASGLGAVIDPERIPYHPAIAQLPERRDYALAAGDDYQLLVALDPEALPQAIETAKAHQVLFTAIGHMTESGRALTTDGTWPQARFQHFRAKR